MPLGWVCLWVGGLLWREVGSVGGWVGWFGKR